MSQELHAPGLSKIKPWFIGFAVLMVGLAIIGGFRAYSPIPMGDSWDGNIAFYLNTLNGNWGAWWAQHNEHRIVLSKIFFWVNNHYFGGSNAFLVMVNFSCITASAYLFWRILRNITGTQKPSNEEICCGLFMTGWLFLWCQQENLLWEFQNQFILAQLLPLAALFWLYKSKSSKRNFFIACIFGIASAVSMANGILTLPLMVVYSALVKQSLKRTIFLSLLAASLVTLYLYQYQSPSHHSTLLQSLQKQPLELLQYFLYYLGSPFRYLFHLKFLALIAGIFMVCASTYMGVRALVQKNELLLFLMLFNSYVIVSALGTASGRVIFGVDQAFASRYTTPALMAWAALFLAFLPNILKLLHHTCFNQNHKKNIALLIIAALLMLSVQLKTLGSHAQSHWMRDVAALALAMQVNDEKQIQEIAGSSQATLEIAKPAANLHIGFFGNYPFKDLLSELNTPSTIKPSTNCSGEITAIRALPSDDQFLRIEGEISIPNNPIFPELLNIVNSNHQKIGFAITKDPSSSRLSFKKDLGANYQFIGYFLKRDDHQSIEIQADNGQCHLIAPSSAITTR
jgi:hypothetical protein